MYKSTLFTILFYLGCANDFAVWGRIPVTISESKHKKANANSYRQGKWNGRR